jgi:hypothetical protein
MSRVGYDCSRASPGLRSHRRRDARSPVDEPDADADADETGWL